MLELIEAYLKDKELAWAEKTKLNVGCTLRKLAPHLTGDPGVLWGYLVENQAPYTRVITWGKVCQFWDFARPGVNPYREFRSKNKRLFIDQYVRRPATETVDDALGKINSIEDPAIRRKALELLHSGMRWSESFTLKNGFIVGKGGLQREVFLPNIKGPEYTGSYSTFLRALKDVGLKTHSLRKIRLTKCANDGATMFELQAIAGWKGLSSASSYIGVRRERLKELMGVKKNDRK